MHIPMYIHILIHINRFKANGELRIGKQKAVHALMSILSYSYF